MAGNKHNPFESPTCSIAEAILWVAYRDVARIRDAPSLFSLQQWPDEVTTGFWLLLHALAHKLEKSPKSDAALAPVLEKKESSLGKVAPSTLFVVRRDFKELIEQSDEHEPN
jgi:hypothetical protein